MSAGIAWSFGFAVLRRGGLMDAAHDLTSRRFGAAALFQRAGSAVRLTGPIDDRIGLGDVSARVFERTPLSAQRVPLRATIFVGLFAPAKLAAGQGVIVALPPFPHRHMWLYAFVVDHPREHCRRSVRGVADEALGCDLEAFLDPIYHRLSGLNFGCAMNLPSERVLLPQNTDS